MRPALCPRLVNGPLEDPVLYINLRHQSRAILLDCGEIATLAPRDILKISHIFISHTHMDHFAGFDRILRLTLGREQTLQIFGPAGFLKNLENKLGAYTWNLVCNYPTGLKIIATEITDLQLRTRRYTCQSGFKAQGADQVRTFDGDAAREPDLVVNSRILDHRIPCLGFAVKEKIHINVMKTGLDDLGLVPGPWLQTFKAALQRQPDAEAAFYIPQTATRSGKSRIMPLNKLARHIARMTRGSKIAYIVDAAGTPANVEKMVDLARHADHLYIEAAFAHDHHAIALQKAHLTARQAGIVAGRAGVRRFTPIHISPRYSDAPQAIMQEAREAYSEHFQPPPDGDNGSCLSFQ